MIDENLSKVGKISIGDSIIKTRTSPKESCDCTIQQGKYTYEYEEFVHNDVLRRTELSIKVDEKPFTSRDVLKLITFEENPVDNNGVFFSIEISHYNPDEPIRYFINCSLNRITVHAAGSHEIIFNRELSEENLNKAFDEVLGLVVNLLPVCDATIEELRNVFWNNFPFITELFNESFKVPVYFYETGSIALGERLTNAINKRNEDIKRLDSRLSGHDLCENDYDKEKSAIINKSNVEINNISMLLEQLRLFVEQQVTKGTSSK